MTTGDRARAAVDRLDRAAMSAGLTTADSRGLTSALAASLDRRSRYFADAHHTDFLHPARTALILLHDTALNDAAALTAAVLFDSEAPVLSFSAAEAGAMGGPAAASVLAALPVPASAGDELLERLVAAEERVRFVALAERLDHARRLHLRSTERWYALHAEIEGVYLPVAERTNPTLARRFRRWADMFAERYL